jgi:hypothetical protein
MELCRCFARFGQSVLAFASLQLRRTPRSALGLRMAAPRVACGAKRGGPACIPNQEPDRYERWDIDPLR